MILFNKNRYIIRSDIGIFLASILDLLLSLTRSRKGMPDLDEVKNILIIKPCHLGDMLMLSSVLPSIKKRFPNVNIDMIIGEWTEVILKGNPYVRNKYIVNHCLYGNRKRISKFSKIVEFVRTYFKSLIEIRKNEYDLCFNMRIYKANLMTLLPFIKTKYNVGYGVFGFGPLLDMEVKWIQGIHEVECFLECLKPFGINVALKDLSYELYPTNDDEIYVDKVIKENNLDNYIVIHPFSGAPERMLPLGSIPRQVITHDASDSARKGSFSKNKRSDGVMD